MFRTSLVAAALVALPAAAQTPLVTAALPAGQRQPLEQFLQKLEKPTQFVPARAKWTDVGAGNVVVDTAPAATEVVREYLAEVRPQKAVKDAPARADVYFYRPNPKKGAAGITVKRVVDLTTGEQVGEPEVLVNHATPITREERTEAMQTAKAKSPVVQKLLDGAEPGDVQAVTLFEQVTAKGLPDASPGDRVATLQLRRKGSDAVVNVSVNLTRGTVLDRN